MRRSVLANGGKETRSTAALLGDAEAQQTKKT